ncbi:hypothetical protein M9Y10_042937 [Tritrichomonas musculus]|uniref:Protein kinase domain-containing protein n=1 Tax=Tritrichomonas musculus TaxID=1915356 RepID=A0ABR2JYE7_9EUKA
MGDSIEETIALFKSSNFPTFDTADYQFIQEIGRGNYGCAKLCKDRNTEKKVVIKTLFSNNLDINVIREIDIMNRLHHPCLIALFATDIDESDEDSAEISLLMPYLCNNSLEDAMKKTKNQKWDITAKMKALVVYINGVII